MDASDEEFDLDDDVDLNTMAAAYEFTLGRLWHYQDHPGVPEVIAVLTMNLSVMNRVKLKSNSPVQKAGSGGVDVICVSL